MGVCRSPSESTHVRSGTGYSLTKRSLFCVMSQRILLGSTEFMQHDSLPVRGRQVLDVRVPEIADIEHRVDSGHSHSFSKSGVPPKADVAALGWQRGQKWINDSNAQ